MSVTEVQRDEIDVLYVAVRGPESAPDAFAELESKLDSLRGRKFYGAFYASSGEYRACVVATQDDQDVGLVRGTLPGGRYLQTKLRAEPPELYQQIGPAFDELSRAAASDRERPSLEFYRRRDEVVLLLPIEG